MVFSLVRNCVWGLTKKVTINTLEQIAIGFIGIDSNSQVNMSEQNNTDQTRKSVV